MVLRNSGRVGSRRFFREAPVSIERYGGFKAADANATGADSCCAAQTEQVCDSAKACCQADSAVCPKAACDSAKCDKPCEKK